MTNIQPNIDSPEPTMNVSGSELTNEERWPSPKNFDHFTLCKSPKKALGTVSLDPDHLHFENYLSHLLCKMMVLKSMELFSIMSLFNHKSNESKIRIVKKNSPNCQRQPLSDLRGHPRE